jgi:hypothetical protein
MHHLRWLTPAAALLVVTDPMAGLGHSRRFRDVRDESGLRPIADVMVQRH